MRAWSTRTGWLARTFSVGAAMAGMKIISIIDHANTAQAAALDEDLRTLLAVVEDDLDEIKDALQGRIIKLEQRVAELEREGGIPEVSA